MRRRILSVLCSSFVLALASCASAPISLDHVAGVYTTHFDGIPDQSRVCAVLTNRGASAVSWVRLRMVGYSDLDERRGRLVSHWVLAEPLAPGQSATFELLDPPVVREVELSVQRTGTGGQAPVGRPVQRTESCDTDALQAAVEADQAGRTATGIEVVGLVDRGADQRDSFVASD